MARKLSRSLKELEPDFIRLFNQLLYARQPWQVWQDIMIMSACAISNACDKTKSHWDERESLYLETIKKYKKSEQEIIPCIFQKIQEAIERNPHQDFLGSIYMKLNLGDHWKGQFFTPYSVCSMMGAIVTDTCVDKIEKTGWATLNDCACGAGATLIAGIHSIEAELRRRDSNLKWWEHVLVTAQDVDYITALMCYIQLSLQGAAGYIKIGNTFSDPMSSADDPTKSNYWFTPMYFHTVWKMRKVFHGLDWSMLPQDDAPAKTQCKQDDVSDAPQEPVLHSDHCDVLDTSDAECDDTAQDIKPEWSENENGQFTLF